MLETAEFKKLPIMGILRGIREEDVGPLAECAVSSGLGTVEIAMNTPGAPGLITKMRRAAGGRLSIGAGTVLKKKDLAEALDAGGEFIVSPAVIPEVAEECVKMGVPVFPGAFTPGEVYRAHAAGAAMVKVFPAGALGPRYIKELKGPFDKIELLACGGVSAGNIGDFFRCGASAAAFGAGIFRPEYIAERAYAKIREEIKKFIEAFKNELV